VTIHSNNIKVKYLITGLIVGLVISILISFITISINNFTFSISSIIQLNEENPINLFLLISPIFILSIIGYLIGLSIEKVITINNKELTLNKKRFDRIYHFIETLRKGKAEVSIDENLKRDKIGISLINLRDEIEKNKEENKTGQEEEVQRRWISEGLALFGAILREYNESVEILANKVLSELVKYTDAKQAGFYIIEETNDNKKIIKELSNFAYSKKRLANKEILWGEGIIGACIIEKKTTFLDSISENYTKIESGLGSAKPKSILIVPLMTEEGIIHGAIELTSFKIYKDFEIKFTEQIAESIATTISSIKINAETGKLLEESERYALTMTKQKEELGKTISDMERLQENADIQSTAFRAYQDSTNKALISAEYSNDGKLLFANKKFLDLFEYKSYSEIQNESISFFLHSDNSEWFEEHQENILSNKHFEGLLNYTTKNGKEKWIVSSYIGLRNDKAKVEKILFLGIDTTSLKEDSKILHKKINNFNDNNLKIELSLNGDILKISNKLLNLLNYNFEDLFGKNINLFIDKDDSINISNIIENINNSGQSYEGEFNINNSENSKIWLRGNMYQDFDSDNNPTLINITAYDYSSEYLAKQKTDELNEQITKQETELNTLKERLIKKGDQTKDEMRELYAETETNNIFYKQTLMSLPEAIITIDNDNKIQFINKNAMIIFSIEGGEYLNQNIKTILPDISDNYKGLYLGDILDYNSKSILKEKEELVFIINKDGIQEKYKMIISESVIGLRKRLTAILSSRINN